MVVLVGTARSDINQEPIHRGRDQNPSTVSQQSRSSGAAGGTTSELLGSQLSPNYKSHI